MLGQEILSNIDALMSLLSDDNYVVQTAANLSGLHIGLYDDELKLVDGSPNNSESVVLPHRVLFQQLQSAYQEVKRIQAKEFFLELHNIRVASRDMPLFEESQTALLNYFDRLELAYSATLHGFSARDVSALLDIGHETYMVILCLRYMLAPVQSAIKLPKPEPDEETLVIVFERTMSLGEIADKLAALSEIYDALAAIVGDSTPLNIAKLETGSLGIWARGKQALRWLKWLFPFFASKGKLVIRRDVQATLRNYLQTRNDFAAAGIDTKTMDALLKRIGESELSKFERMLNGDTISIDGQRIESESTNRIESSQVKLIEHHPTAAGEKAQEHPRGLTDEMH